MHTCLKVVLFYVVTMLMFIFDAFN